LDLLAAMDVFAMPSRTESFGIVYLEAWAYGKPVIGAQTWGVSDVIDHRKDGLLVPFGDVPALVEAIAELLDHPGVRARMGARGQDKVSRLHTWDRKYAILHCAYREVVSAK
jgi:glycosyltransferase involved in cell wall biosynthesis